MKRGGGLHPATPDWWPRAKRPRETPGGLIAASVTCLSHREGMPPCLRTSPPLCGTLVVHRTSWRIPFPRHAWYWGSEALGCRTLRLESQSSAGLRMQHYPRAQDLVWPRHLHSTGCSRAQAMDTGFPTVLWRLCLYLGCAWARDSAASATPGCGDGLRVCLRARSACTPPLLAGVCGVGVCAWARVSAAPRHSLLGCWGLCVLVWPLRLYPATPVWGVRCGCLCLGSGFGCAPPLLAGLFGSVCVCVPALLVPRHSWPGCAVWVCVLGLGFWLRPATLGWDVGLCACLCAHSACPP